jgi:hypothetical protein
MTWYLQGLEARPTGLPPLVDRIPTYAESVAAGWRADRIERDVWSQRDRYRARLADEIEATVGAAEPPASPRRETSHRQGARREADLLRRAGLFAAEHPGRIGRLPVDETQFEAEVRRRIERDYADAMALLGNAPEGRIGAETLGRLGSGAADPLTIASLPFGAAGGARIGTTMAVEAGVNMLAEAMDLPRQQEMAEYLDIEAPDPLLQIGVAGLIGGGIGGLMAGAARYVDYRRTRGRASADTRPPGRTEAEHAAELAAAQRSIEEDRAASSPAGPDFGAFDFSRGGNASPDGNRVGYVFGRLLELGYEPHVAAGLVGNLMQESGAGLSTRAVGDNGNAFGMAQWNGPRRHAYLAFARARGADAGDLDTQIAFLHHEMQTSEAGAAARIRGARSAGEAALVASQAFWRPGVPHNANRVAYAQAVMRQFEGGSVPRWTGAAPRVREGDPGAIDWSATTRGYTREGQVSTASGRRIGVAYEIVDIARLRPAGGDLQPRDRTRATSDAWVAETAASLDPARLMPAPTADRGAPIVGPDDVIESGNGRVMAIGRAYDLGLDRSDAYRAAVLAEAERLGIAVPEGVERPVLVARRTSYLDDAARRDFVVEAQDSGVAEMTPTEVAAATARQLTTARLATADPARPVTAPENAGFVRSVLAALPASQRNRLFKADGRLNADGRRLLEQALFARAWDAADIVDRAVEAEEAGPLRTLMDALQEAAAAWAALRADIEAGLVRPEFDITAEVLDAVRSIAAAREMAAGYGRSVADILEELLAEIDIIDGAVSPLTIALARRFHAGGRALPAKEIAGFLRAYAVEARQAGRAGDLAPVGLAEVLRRIDPKAFGGLPDDFARAPARSFRGQRPASAPEPREDAFSEGARSPEVAEADAAATEELRAPQGPFGPVFAGYRDDPEGAIQRLLAERRGEVPDAFVHPDFRDVAFVYGQSDLSGRGGFGIAHIIQDHDPETLSMLPQILREGVWTRLEGSSGRQGQRVRVDYDDGQSWRAIVRLDYDRRAKAWVLTSYRLGGDARQPGSAYVPARGAPPDFPGATGRSEDTLVPPSDQDDGGAALRAAIDGFRAEDAEILLPGPDGRLWKAGDLLEEIEADMRLADVIDACGVGRRA